MFKLYYLLFPGQLPDFDNIKLLDIDGILDVVHAFLF